jgi:hypothetical protein
LRDSSGQDGRGGKTLQVAGYEFCVFAIPPPQNAVETSNSRKIIAVTIQERKHFDGSALYPDPLSVLVDTIEVN